MSGGHFVCSVPWSQPASNGYVVSHLVLCPVSRPTHAYIFMCLHRPQRLQRFIVSTITSPNIILCACSHVSCVTHANMLMPYVLQNIVSCVTVYYITSLSLSYDLVKPMFSPVPCSQCPHFFCCGLFILQQLERLVSLRRNDSAVCLCNIAAGGSFDWCCRL